MSSDKEKMRERKKILGGLGLSLIVFGWFLYYTISHIPSSGS
ncbi:MAG: hypothetical protein R8M38_01580 [Mariprofundaceae bacterium]